MSAFLPCVIFLLVCFVIVGIALHNAPMDAERDKRER